MEREAAVKDAWEAQQPWVTLDERPELEAHRDTVEKMLRRAWTSGYDQAQAQMQIALGLGRR